jgi:site-specific recombinase XerD
LWSGARERPRLRAGFRFHDVRHDFATKLLRQTKSLKLVSIALNHADVKTTSRYAHVLDGEVADALQRLSQSKKSHAGNDRTA